MLNNFQIAKNSPLFPIRTAAKLLNVSIPTLRMYENAGLIIPSKTESNQRIYSEEDLERIKCIRRAIKEEKISINGIKTIFSLTPCWEITSCKMEKRANCPAYLNHTQPCWSLNREKNHKCKECKVYLNIKNCDDVKKSIQQISERRK